MEVFKKITLARNENDALLALAHMRQGRVIPLTENIALSAEIFTQESHFKGLKGVRFCEGGAA